MLGSALQNIILRGAGLVPEEKQSCGMNVLGREQDPIICRTRRIPVHLLSRLPLPPKLIPLLHRLE